MSLALIFCREIFTMHRPAILMMVSPIATGWSYICTRGRLQDGDQGGGEVGVKYGLRDACVGDVVEEHGECCLI
jgi:hypothetical protein